MKTLNKTNRLAILFEWILIAVIYFVFAKIGQLFAISPGNVTPVWIPSGIIFAWVYIRGYYVWPGIFIGAFVGNVWAYFNFNSFSNIAESLLAGSLNGFGDVLCAIVAIFLIRRFSSEIKLFNTVKSVILFVIFGSILGSAISSVFGVSGLAISGFIQWQAYIYVWITWFIGDAVGVVVFAPLILMAINWKLFIISLKNNKKRREFVFFVVSMAATCYLWILLGNTYRLLHAPFAIFLILLIWSIFRFEDCVTFYTVFLA
jgi:integral membrane sensor domain MASE1